MPSLDEIISESRDVREVKRALSIKMLENGLSALTLAVLLTACTWSNSLRSVYRSILSQQ